MALLTLPSLLQAQSQPTFEKKKIVVVGGHPDDPESGCGGTIVKLVQAGHEVTLMYLTNGDAGIEGKTLQEAAAIRTKECVEACKILGTKPLFVGQVDGDSVMSNAELARFKKLLYGENPHVVFTQWPIDSHKDHQIASLLTIQAWLQADKRFPLYFYEVCTGEQTFGFHPTEYVDITDAHAQKLKSLACHDSQGFIGENGDYTPAIYKCGHPSMEDFRGRELGVPLAEAFVKMTGGGLGNLII